jgi:adenine deaminase
MNRTIAALGALTLTAAPAFADDHGEAPLTVIHAGHLIAAPGEERVQSEVSILVRGDSIEAIENGFVSPDGAEIVDLSNAWVMPGFIDAPCAHHQRTRPGPPHLRLHRRQRGPRH